MCSFDLCIRALKKEVEAVLQCKTASSVNPFPFAGIVQIQVLRICSQVEIKTNFYPYTTPEETNASVR